MPDQLSELHPLELQVLRATPERGSVTEAGLAAAAGLSADHTRTAVSRLLGREAFALDAERKTQEVSLTEAGRQLVESGPPELVVARAVEAAPMTVPELTEATGLDQTEVGKAVGALKKAGVAAMEEGAVYVVDGADLAPLESVHELLRRIGRDEPVPMDDLTEPEREAVLARFRKRGKDKGVFAVAERTVRSYALTDAGRALRADALSLESAGDEITQLTPDLLRDGSWKGRSFRGYRVDAAPPKVYLGRPHPYRAFLDRLKGKLTALGFEEMRGSLVENEFWNMDALYMPQFHSARDIHDVYFVQEPSHARELEEPFAGTVAAAHENGGTTGSRGWGYAFDRDRSRRLVLRSQGTVLSARTLASGPKVPGKYYAIARCFRYDQVDATHAADFFQVEGIVLGRDIQFRTLLGLLTMFAREVARADEVRFRPGYFPFTEPSVEAFIRHPSLGWIEMGGAGLFRPEVTRPLGVDVPVIAWGLGIDRMAMVALGIADIRDLLSSDLEFIRTRSYGLKEL